jgi:hypothetical protein
LALNVEPLPTDSKELMEFLTVMEQDVDIPIRPRHDRTTGHISVLVVQSE